MKEYHQITNKLIRWESTDLLGSDPIDSTSNYLSRELETIKNQLADAEKSLNVWEREIHAEDKELRTKEEKIEAVEEAAADAINISQSQTNIRAWWQNVSWADTKLSGFRLRHLVLVEVYS